ncbi:hypothetical protein ILUMI_10475 [Ignelater luminosus]|uniref:Peptidase M13 N-terminal domain-containing protein n=1 Tax=Ignelater luminosus TaxID=2038154 RepID=A0A8K0G8N4_IGNLU|nr:hypothetical protein ILUMI_10475 [Ignelater luminosus]
MEKRLIIALILAVIISMALMFALIFARPIIVIAQNSEHLVKENKCLTAGCIKAAGQILERLDENIEPCDDFYKFVCGNYIKKTVIPPSKSLVNLLESIPDKIKRQMHVAIEQPVKDNEFGTISIIKDYYQACVNKTLREKYTRQFLLDLLNQTADWPVLSDDQWNQDEFDWKELMYKYREKGLNLDSFIITSVDVNPRNSSKHIIKIKQPEFTFIKNIVENNFTKAYYDFIVDTAVLLGANKQKVLEELRQSMEFEIKLYNKLMRMKQLNYLLMKCNKDIPIYLG